MSALVARQPLHPLPMSSLQRGPRRLSARLQKKEEPQSDGTAQANSASNARSTQEPAPHNSKKRKNWYDEDDDGFAFTRVKKKLAKVAGSQAPAVAAATPEPETLEMAVQTAVMPAERDDAVQSTRKRRNKMSFSTPKITEPKPVRRSKRLSDENEISQENVPHKTRRKDDGEYSSAPTVANGASTKGVQAPPRENTPAPTSTITKSIVDDHSSTRIALPFADTPVIRRNKAMREGKSGKGDRRSSLGLRGRRASSLIETGNSNALPHSEVEVQDFYKHIESESLPEPKRMRQLLTWCATRALGEKPMGTAFEDVSVKQAARIVEEELLKDLANKSEMSDWFGREDAPQSSAPLEERPHPKNIQNLEKIAELEEQIRRLRAERASLQSLLRPPEIPLMPPASTDPASLSAMDRTLLSTSDAAYLDSLSASSNISTTLSTRLNSLTTSLGPAIDAFADGIHKITQYRDAVDNVASRTLAICAGKLSEREELVRRQGGADMNPKRDLSSVLRGLSRLEK